MSWAGRFKSETASRRRKPRRRSSILKAHVTVDSSDKLGLLNILVFGVVKMKSTRQFGLPFVAVTVFAFGTAVGQDARQDQDRRERAQSQPAAAQNQGNAGKLDEKTRGNIIRVSQLMGMNIVNRQGESVGEIKDIALDSASHKVCYAAVSYGGFLGFGNKLFAVPFEAFQVQVKGDATSNRDRSLTASDYVLVLNVTQEQLEGQEGFDQDNWPNLGDESLARALDKRYGVNREEDEKDRLLRENRNR